MKINKKFPLWALFLGCILSAGISFIQARALNGMAADFITGSAFLGLFIIVLILNPVLMTVRKTWSLSSSEMLLIFIMGAAACVLPSWGLMGGFIPIIAGLSYYATSENRWTEIILPHIKKYFIPTNSRAINQYFTGVPNGAHYSYLPWVKPLIVWFLFLMAFYFLSMCIAVILRKQWEENEQLMFPLAMLPVDMTKMHENSRLPIIFKNKLFWTGFAITFIITSFTAIPSYFPFFPNFILGKGIPIFRNTTMLVFVLSWPILGFAYLVNLNISFSLFFFQFLSKIETGWFNITGFSIPGQGGIFAASSPMVAFQGAGATIVFFIYLVWQARKHIGDVFRKAFGGGSKNIDDSPEMLSYRTSVLGGIISILIMEIFFHLMGMPLILSFVYLFYLLATFVVLNRVICQAGLGFARSQCDPPGFSASVLPSNYVGHSGYIGLGLQYPYAGDIRTTVMTSTQTGLKINKEAGINPRFLFWGIVIAVIIAYFVAAFSNIQNGYLHGELNVREAWFSQDFPQLVGQFMANKINSPPTKEIILSRYWFMGIGAVIMSVLIFFQNSFLWWPLHYIGFPISDSYIIDRGWFSIFLAWMIKFLVLKYGGVQVYRRSIPIFYGIILGSVVATGAWMGVGYVYHIVTGQTVTSPYFGI
ncbi:MAG: hypothetical protein M1135_01290 [Candidatus Omnitrophica bacterium]|nr:hypothetical protein [Candidatus Omnitrophota bacterium]